MANTEVEIWKQVVGWDGEYQISNFGVVKSLARTRIRNNGKPQFVPETVLSKRSDKYGYLHVTLRKEASPIKCSIHRLIAKAFIPNPENKPCVNHINGIKSDNRVENLEWATVLENNIHALHTGLKVMPKGKECYLFGMSGKSSHVSKRISKCDMSGNILKTYDSLAEAAIDNNIKNSNGLSIFLSGKHKRNQAYGFKWKLEKNEK